jgi:hypothetical protein
MLINSAKLCWQIKKKSKTNFFFFQYKYMGQHINLYFKGTQAFKIITI